ncbi:MAG: thioredoxin family protein [Aquificaceae bacterium]
MKLLLVILTGFSLAIAGWFNNVKEGLEVAKKENMPVAFYFYSNFCPYCAQMEEFVLNQEDVQRKLDKFVVISLNISSDDGSTWARRFGVPGVPTIVFYDPKQDKTLGVLFGSRPRGEVLNYINNVCKRANIKAC